MESATNRDALLGALYEGPLEEPPFQSFLADVRRALDADLVTLLLRPPSLEAQAVMLADGGSLSAMRSYNEGQFVLDPFVDLPDGEVVSLHDYVSSDALLASDFYRTVMEPQGWYDFLGVDLRSRDEIDARLRAGRYRGGEAFGDQEAALLASLMPHLRRALRLQARMSRSERERAVYAGAVEQLRVATIILDEQGLVLSTNDAASDLLAEGRGMAIEDGRVRLAQRDADEELRELVRSVRRTSAEAAPAPAAAMRVPAGDRDLGLVVRALPSAPNQSHRTPSVALFVSDPREVTEPPRQAISRLYGLTPAEANLAMLLAEGLSLDEASEELAISRNTARAHLRSIFAKTDVTRQSGLVRLVLRSVAPLAGEGAK